MNTFTDFDRPTRVIMHFLQDEARANQHGARIVYYQVEIDTDPAHFSPDGRFVRFNHENGICEVHGWVLIDDIVIDSVLEEYIEEEDEWKAKAA